MAALAIVRRWLGEPAQLDAAAEGRVPLARFQRDAVMRALAIMERWGGVLIADDVGLGKTHIAAALVEQAIARQQRVLVVVPAPLQRMWLGWLRPLAKGMRSYGIDARTTLRGPLRLALLTHTRLAFGRYPLEALRGIDLVVVDEAHAFRNPATHRYRALLQLCAGARVVLLTATPVNNALRDLHSQLRLFAREDHFCDLGVADLSAAFAGAEVQGAASAPLQRLLAAIVIRRTHAQVEDDAQFRVPRLVAESVRYDLAGRFGAGWSELLHLLGALTLAPLRLGAYGLTDHSARAAPELLRLHLLKRLESSTIALAASIDRLRRLSVVFAEQLAQGRVLSSATFHALLELPGRKTLQTVLSELVLPLVGPRARVRNAIADTEADLERLRRLGALLEGSCADPKLVELMRLLDKHAHERVIVFTEFRETARYLHRALLHRRRVALVDGETALLGAARAARERVLRSFQELPPNSRRARLESVDVLIATDVLSEGLNLQSARVVVSYDLPWNPVRLMQRIGRARRIGSAHAEVCAAHFLPDRGLEELLGLMRRIDRKLTAIRSAVGLEGDPFGRRTAGTSGAGGVDPDFLTRLASGDADALDHPTQWASGLAALQRLRVIAADSGDVEPGADGVLVARCRCGPVRRPSDSATKRRRPEAACPDSRAPAGALVAVEGLVGTRVVWLPDDGRPSEDIDVVANRLEHALLDSAEAVADFDVDLVMERALRFLDAQARSDLLAVRHPRDAAAADRMAAHLLRLMESVAPSELQRIERALQRLDQSLSLAEERALTELLSRQPGPTELLDAVDRCLGAPVPGRLPLETMMPFAVLRFEAVGTDCPSAATG